MMIQLRTLLVFLLALSLAPAAFAANKKAPRKIKAKQKKSTYAPKLVPVPDLPPPPPVAVALVPRPAAPSTNVSLAPVDLSPTRLVNFRLHPIYFVDMIAQHDTLAAARVDLDFIVSDRFTLGPSLMYQRTSAVDSANLAAGGSFQTTELTRWDLGVLSNVYLFGTSREGGLIFRPHAYYVSVSGEKQDANDATVANGSATDGWRAGAEVVYQKILPVGLNFEIGGGFTYHLSPYDVTYSDSNGLKHSAPDNTVEPTVSIGIGWAF